MIHGNHALANAGLGRGAVAALALAWRSASVIGCRQILGIDELNDGRDRADASVPLDAPSSELFVDPVVGTDQDDCSRTRPCGTLTHALARVKAGQTIYLGDGTYSADSGEHFDTVPAGVTIEAMTPGGATLLGNPDSATALTLQGDATIRGLHIRGFYAAISALEGEITLDSLAIEQTNVGLVLQGPARVVAQSVSFTAGGQAFEMGSTAELRLVGGTISDMGPICASSVGIGALRGAAHVIFEGVTAQNNLGGLVLRDDSSADLEDSTLIDNGADACDPSTHIDLRESATVRLTNTTIERGPGFGIHASDESQISIMGGSFDGEGQTAALSASGTSLDVRGTKFSGYLTAIRLGRGNNVVREAEITGNDVGIEIDVDASGFLDAGTIDQPGNNAIRQNDTTGLVVRGTIRRVINALGNTWNPGEQSADENGLMATGPAIEGPVAGSNYEISSTGPSIQF
ncbi:MAG TPA: right-handed parallel beta-helix repeat-containing protein [Haliangium sp.]|nr:right-handed parallel beta-helix repeat-containing protein [Haliangium sp.]